MRPVTLTWVGGEHDFALTIGGLRAVQDASNAGPQEIAQRLAIGSWRIDDLGGVIRHGLEGGGMDKVEAQNLIRKMMDQYPLMDFVVTAQTIITAALVGVEDDPVGESEGVTPMQAPENGASATFTDKAQ
jgi:hypothetical protein